MKVDHMGSRRYLVFAVLGLGFLMPYFQRLFFRVTLFYEQGENALRSFGILLIFMTLFLIAACIWNRRFESLITKRQPMITVAICLSVVGNGCLRGVIQVPEAGRDIITFLSIVIYAASLIALAMIWFLTLHTLSMKRGLWDSVTVLVLSALVGCLISPTSSDSPLAIIIVPVGGLGISALFALLCRPLLDMPYENDVESSRTPFLKSSLKPWMFLLISALMVSFMHAILFFQDITGEVYAAKGQLVVVNSIATSVIYFAFASIFLAISLSASHAKRGYVSMGLWYAVFGCSIGLFSGLFLAAFLYGNPDQMLAWFVNPACGCLRLLMFIVPLMIVYQDSISPIRTFGILVIGLTIVDEALCYFLAPRIFNSLLIGRGGILEILQVAIGFLVLLTLTGFLVELCKDDLLKNLFRETSVDKDAGASERNRETACDRIADEYGLTKREGEILYLLSLGHSAKKIAETFTISERTVQYHVSNIYGKLDVHSKQEIIDTVDGRMLVEK